MINKQYLKRLILFKYGSLRAFAHEIEHSEKTVYLWFSCKSGHIPASKLYLILKALDGVEIDKSKLIIL